MNTWARVNDLFHAASVRSSSDRAAFLASECGDDTALRAEIESLLAAHDANGASAVSSCVGPGTRVGDYEVTAFLAAGAMGEVYRARDTKLGREVALKILPSASVGDPERHARFEREARLLASLNHPNVAIIYGFVEVVSRESGRSTSALALELVEGETLTERIARGGIAASEALRIAGQIVEALHAAHEHGVIHRDLKPANVKLTPEGVVKVLDFGLAKLARPATAPSSPTPAEALKTEAGLLVGTPAYMSPEQARGQAVDKRSDIWAFGCVLFELLTLRPAFPGKTVSDTIAGILERQPDWSALPEKTPASVERVLRRCLEKDPTRRLHDVADAGIEILDASTSPGVSPSAVSGTQDRTRPAWTRVAGLIALASLALTAWAYLERPPPESDVFYRSSILPPEEAPTLGASPSGRLALSPDGRSLAFIAVGPDGIFRLWVRRLDALRAEPLTGTEGATAPFWSPDSRFIGYFDTPRGKLKKVDANGGPPMILADSAGQPGASWGKDDVIVFAITKAGNPLTRVLAAGGPVSAATTIDDSQGESQHWLPFFLPDGRRFLYLAVGSTSGGLNAANGIYVGSLDSDERKLLVPGGSNPKYANGHLLFLRQQTLMAQPFDLERLQLTGEAVPIAEQVTVGGLTGVAGAFSVSETGVLAYQSGSAASRLVWFDRSGEELGAVGEQADFGDVELSPDRTRAAVSMPDITTGTTDIWLFDMARGLRTRFTFDAAVERWPVWSPDGGRVIFGSTRKAASGLYQKASSGVGREDGFLAADPDEAFPLDWSSDGRFLVYNSATELTGPDLSILPLFGDRKPFAFLQTRFSESAARFAPDGRWLAYVSTESGRPEVYVTSFPGPGGKWQVSTGGGNWPRWRRDGQEIFYVAPNSRLMAAAVNGQGTEFSVGRVEALFETRLRLPQAVRGLMPPPYDVSADARRFLVNTLTQDPASTPITLVVNWPALLNTRP